MKKQFQKIAFWAVSISLFNSCREHQMIDIPTLGAGVVTSERKVLIEEFTGVRCPNCPQGSAAIEDLLFLYPENLIAVSIHAGQFSMPLDESVDDFRTAEGSAIETFLGKPAGYPAAVVDRKLFDGDNDLQGFKAQWPGRIKEQLDTNPTKLGVGVVNIFDAASRVVNVAVTLLPTENLAGDLRLSVMLTESGIVDWQDVQGDKIADYVHKHVLRAMLTPFDGFILGGEAKAGVAIEKQFSFTLPAKWNAEKCKIIAFAHFGGAPSKEVLQAEERGVTE